MEIKKLLLAILQTAAWLIFLRFIISWLSPKSNNEFIGMLIRVTDPILRPIRRLLPIPGVDFSPLVAWLLIQFLMKVIREYGS